VIYAAMVKRLPYPTEEDSNPRRDFDAHLEVWAWPKAGREPAVQVEKLKDQPEWWESDEEASQSFFRAMGIDPTKL
jgi:hypothetical protein